MSNGKYQKIYCTMQLSFIFMMPGSKGHCATGGCAWYTKFGLISVCFGWYWRLHLAPFLCMLTFQNQKRPFDSGIIFI